MKNNKLTLSKLRNVIKEEIKFQLTKKNLFESIDSKTLKRILKEDEMGASLGTTTSALGGKPNPTISAPDFSENGGIINISNIKGIAGIIIKTSHSSTIKNIMPPPDFEMSTKDAMKLQYNINLSTTQGDPIKNIFKKAFKQYKAEYDAVKNMIVYTIDFNDSYQATINNRPIKQTVDISLPAEYRKAYMSGKFKIDIQQI